MTLAVSFDVANPNRFPLIVHAVDGRFSLGAGAGVELGKAHAEPASSIPAEGTSTVTSQVAIGWTNLAALTPFMLSPAAVPYRFDGNATLGGESLNVKLPFTLDRRAHARAIDQCRAERAIAARAALTGARSAAKLSPLACWACEA